MDILPTATALILIDMQKGMNEPRLGARNNPGAESNMLRLLAAWRRSGRPVVHVRHMSRFPGSVFWPGQRGAEFQQDFEPQPGEHVVEKNVPDAFAATGLERWLRQRDIRDVLIAGVITNNSVESTARSAGNLGFRAVVAGDAAYTFDLRDRNGRLWPAEDVHALSLANLEADYARVLDTDQILTAAMRAGAGRG